MSHGLGQVQRFVMSMLSRVPDDQWVQVQEIAEHWRAENPGSPRTRFESVRRAVRVLEGEQLIETTIGASVGQSRRRYLWARRRVQD